MNSFCRVLGLSILGVTAAVAASGQARIVNARLETRAATRGLEAEMRAFLDAQTEPAWIGFSVPATAGGHESCCWNSPADYDGNRCGRCSLESERGSKVHGSSVERLSAGALQLERPAEIVVLLRVADHRIGKVRQFSPDCEVDAGGLRVVWLTGVKPAESVAQLERLVLAGDFSGRNERHAAEGALSAIAMTGDPAADRALERFSAADQPEKLRSQTAFWLGSARGAAGLKTLEAMAKSDPSNHVKEQVAFAFSVSQEPRALDDLILMAKEDSSGHVRGQAMFWLAQKAGHRAAEVISDAIENDPDTSIKRSAVFALSQLPKDEGVPMLIQVARTNKNREVRKQAFFWLGQTNDPRALAFFEEVLAR